MSTWPPAPHDDASEPAVDVVDDAALDAVDDIVDEESDVDLETDLVDLDGSDDNLEEHVDRSPDAVTEIVETSASEEAAADARADVRVDALDDGAAAVGSSQALPFVMTVREHFTALDDVAVTGDARVDAATARLDEVPDLPTAEHVDIYDDVHRRLQDALSDTEVR